MPVPGSAFPALQLALFGGVTIQVHGERVTDLPTRKAEALLIYVVCNPHPHQRETLAELFWDDLPADRATANVRLALNHLRKRFEPFLEITPTTVAIRPDIDCWVDVQVFARALAAQPREAEPLAEALSLYRGDFLQGFHLRSARGFSEWQDAQSIRWRQQALDWMHTLVERYTTRSAYSEGITWATRLLNLDPLDEAAHRQMMLLFARSGRRHDAIRQYQTCRRVLQEELGLEPEPDTEQLYQQVRARPAQRPHTLPPRDGLLLGRTQNLAQVYTWLAAPEARLMTIVGPGGSGKTQLALAAGWRAATEYIGPCSDGVFYMPLLSPGPDSPRIEDAELLVTIAEALQISLSGRRTLLDQLVSALLDKEILIILDNGELLAASARLALGTLLRHTRALRILVPSRERLKVREEQVLEIGGLAYPHLSPVASARPVDRAVPADLNQYASVQLFLEHARRVQSIPGLDAYDRHDQIAIGQICRMVSGLPLAIGLATSWLHIRAPHEIAQDIAQTIDLLVTDMPEVPERHRSMRAVLAHSWQLLNKRERVVLVSLAVFPRSFNAAAAEQIASATLPDLAALCDKSLLQRQTTAAGTRYELHPLLRQWAIEKLQADPTAEATLHTGHARYFAAFAAQCEESLHGAQGADMLNALEREMENLRAGWRWAIATRDIAMLGRYSMALHDVCAIRNWEIEGCQLFQQAATVVRAWIACPDDSVAAPPAAVRVLFCYGALQYTLGNLDAAEVSLQQSRPLLETYNLQNWPEQLFIHRLLGLIAYWRGAYADAMSYLHVSLQLAESVMDQHKVGELLLSIGAVAYAQGDWSNAQQVFQRCLTIQLALGYQWGIGHARRFLGMVAAMRGDTQGARQEYQQSMTIAQQIGNRLGEALVSDQLGLLYLMEQQIEQAESALQHGLDIFQELGIELGSGRVLCHLARLRIAQQCYPEAREYARQAMQFAQRVQAPPLLIECTATAAQLWLQTEPDAIADSTVRATLLALWRHPACAADIRHYIETFFPDRPAAQMPGAAEFDQPWSLEQAQRIVTRWMDGTLQSRLEGYGQFSSSVGGSP